MVDLSGLNGTNEIVERETDTIGDESEDEELVDSESGFKNATYNESDFGDDNFDSMENDPDGDEPDFSIENTEPTEVSQEETEEEIGARLARDRVDPGFSMMTTILETTSNSLTLLKFYRRWNSLLHTKHRIRPIY